MRDMREEKRMKVPSKIPGSVKKTSRKCERKHRDMFFPTSHYNKLNFLQVLQETQRVSDLSGKDKGWEGKESKASFTRSWPFSSAESRSTPLSTLLWI